MTWQTKLAEYLIAFALLGGAYWWIGYSAVENYKDAQQIVQMKADRKQQARYNTLAGEYETLKNKRVANGRTVVKEVEKIVDRVIYRNQCIDSDGLQLANKALSGSTDSSSTDAKMPTTK